MNAFARTLFSSFILIASTTTSYAQSWQHSNDYRRGQFTYSCAAITQLSDENGEAKSLAFSFADREAGAKQIGIHIGNTNRIVSYTSSLLSVSLIFTIDDVNSFTFQWLSDAKEGSTSLTMNTDYGTKKANALLEAISRGSTFSLTYEEVQLEHDLPEGFSDGLSSFQAAAMIFAAHRNGNVFKKTTTQFFQGGLVGSRTAISAFKSCANSYLPRDVVCGPKPAFEKLQFMKDWNGKTVRDITHLTSTMQDYRKACQRSESYFSQWKYGYEGCLRDKRVSNQRCDAAIDSRNNCRHDLRYVIGSFENRFTEWAQCINGG